MELWKYKSIFRVSGRKLKNCLLIFKIKEPKLQSAGKLGQKHELLLRFQSVKAAGAGMLESRFVRLACPQSVMWSLKRIRSRELFMWPLKHSLHECKRRQILMEPIKCRLNILRSHNWWYSRASCLWAHIVLFSHLQYSLYLLEAKMTDNKLQSDCKLHELQEWIARNILQNKILWRH